MAMPLLWAIPLGLYLLSFVIAFSTFARITQVITLLAPMALLQRLRLQRAALLLASRADSVKLLAAQCGFKNEYHFSTAFKRQHGLA